MLERPAYLVSSVDHALRMALLLQQEGPMRGSELAARLGIARSTAHRLCSMLVYRNFAEQADDRRYAPGPALRDLALPGGPIGLLRAAVEPAMAALHESTRETVDLQVLVGHEARFIHSLESPELLRVSSRDGALFPAWRTSGGRAMLAGLEEPEALRILDAGGVEDVRRPELMVELGHTRRRGFALSHEEASPGVTAIAVALPRLEGLPPAAISVAMPSNRFTPGSWEATTAAMARVVDSLRRGGSLPRPAKKAG